MGVSFKNSFRGDRLLWIIVAMLLLISIVAVFSSTALRASLDNTTAFSFLFKQIVFVLLGFTVVYVFHNIPISLYRRFALLGLLTAIVIMVLLMFFGSKVNEGVREFRMMGFRFQPQDFVKIALVVYLAKTIEDGGLDSYKKVFMRLVLPIGILCLLFFRGNLSAALLVGFSGFWILYLSGIKKRYVFYTGCLAAAVLALLVTLQLKFGVQISDRITTGKNRLTAFISDDAPANGQQAASNAPVKFEQKDYARMAVINGGPFGKGPGKSQQRYLLANAQSDFIYAIIIEEYGLIGGMIVLFAYLWLLFRAVMIAKKCTRMFPIILVLGLMLLIVSQAMVNMAVSVGVFPVTGQPLPLVSQGGSSMLFMSAAFGIILAVSRTADKQTLELEQPREELEKIEAEQVS